MASTAVALSASAETTRISTLELIATNCCTHSTPSISGMVRSMVTTSGCVRRNISTAARPLLAAPTTSRRAICWERSMRRRMIFESSTIMSFNVPLERTDVSISSRFRIPGAFGRRQTQCDTRELPWHGSQRNLAADLLHEPGHQIHPHASPRILGGILHRREPGLEEQREHLFRIQGGCLLRRDEPLPQCRLLDLFGRHALPVVFGDELVAGVAEFLEYQLELSLRGLPGAQPVVRGFEAMYDGISHGLHGNILDDAPILIRHRI